MLLHTYTLCTQRSCCVASSWLWLYLLHSRQSRVCCVCGKERFCFSLKYRQYRQYRQYMFAPTGCPSYMRGMVVVWATVTYLAKA